MTEIKISIESQDADKAAKELFQIEGLKGNWAIVSEDSPNKEGTLAVIGTIVGIVGGGIAIAEQIRKWYKEHKQSHSDKQFDVVIVAPNARIVMENATVEEIYEFLKAIDK